MLMRRREVCLMIGFAMVLSTAPALFAEEAAQVQSSPALESKLFLPKPEDRLIIGPCTQSRTCPDGSTVTCRGVKTCGPSGGSGWWAYITCDGVRHYCAA
jgi:hypothetical protein